MHEPKFLNMIKPIYCLVFTIGFLVLSFQYSLAQKKNIADQITHILSVAYPNGNNPGGMVSIKYKDFQYAKGSGVIHLETPKNIDAKTNFRMASVSKQFTAKAIHELIKADKLTLDTRISTFFPNLKGKVGEIQVRQLLNHSSGIADYENLMGDQVKKPLSDADVLRIIEPSETLFFEPGSRFRYSNTAYCLLALIVEQLTGKSYGNAMKTMFFDPFGMKNSLLYEVSRKIPNRAYGYHPQKDSFVFADQSLTSSTLGDGGVYTSASDYGKWLKNLKKELDGLKGEDNYLNVLNSMSVKGKITYSFGWFRGLDASNEPVWFHSGESTGFHNIVLFYPKTGEYVLLFSNRDDLLIAEVFDQIMKTLGVSIQGIDNQPLFTWLSKVYANQIP